ncbi:MAG: HEAT repeat domain-containing protein [Tatlockia sp.]|jgi:hypothetical protein
MKSLLSFIIGCLLASNTLAKPIVDIDVYGVDSKQAEEIKTRYGEQVRSIEFAMQSAIESSVNKAIASKTLHLDNIKPPHGYNQLKKKRQALLNQIKREQNLLFVNAATIFYMPKNVSYTTIEVVSQAHPELLRYTALEAHSRVTHSPADLIDKMTEFSQISMMLYAENKLQEKDTDTRYCPVYHCAINFEHPALKPYLSLFNQGAIKDKTLILNTIKNDSNSERRGAAIFLLGHLNDPHEIISLLLPYVQDHDPLVRNNSIRVIGETVRKAKIHDFDLKPFLALLHSPSTLDRNKSLYVIYEAAQLPTAKKLIVQQSGDILLQLLQLKQPNNHDVTYKILKRLSGKKWGDQDFAAWKQWLASVKTAA